MWLLVLLLAVSVLITAVVRRRGRDARDSVEEQRRRTDALRTATSGSSSLPDEMGTGASGRPSRKLEPRRSLPITGRTVLIGIAVLVAAVAIYAIAAGWGTSSTRDESTTDRTESSSSKSTTTTSSSTTTTTTTPPPVAITGTDGGTVNITVPAGPVKLGITARASCWMMVERADGTEVETTTLSEGDSKQYEEPGPLTVKLGNPAGVDVVVNDQPITLPASNGNSMQLQITPAGA
jgi:cytoskeletal protein RodZ